MIYAKTDFSGVIVVVVAVVVGVVVVVVLVVVVAVCFVIIFVVLRYLSERYVFSLMIAHKTLPAMKTNL